MNQEFKMDVFFFDRIPNEDEIDKLNKAFQEVDYDFPSLNYMPTYNQKLHYRFPSLSGNLIANILCLFGFPCEVKLYAIDPRTSDITNKEGKIYCMSAYVSDNEWVPDKIEKVFVNSFTRIYNKE